MRWPVHTDRQPLLGKALQGNATIGLVAPAGPVRDKESYERGISILQDLGYKVLESTAIDMPCPDYLAAGDAARACQFNTMWANPQVDALMAVRGGYGSLRMADLLDLSLIALHPKPFIGFSDITMLHSIIGSETGLVTFHGPVLTSLAKLDAKSISHLHTVLSGNLLHSLPWKDPVILRGGEATGELQGGNLTTLTHLMGTPFEPDWQDAILFLEDVSEAPYRLDRMLTQLQLAGKLKGLKGLLLGSFTDCGDLSIVWERALQITEEMNIPLWGNFPVGHGSRNLAVPLGIDVKLSSADNTLIFNKPCLQQS
jgi:muramoyltetrapeptide carboxypeptidase